jgi:hypothetical protein
MLHVRPLTGREHPLGLAAGAYAWVVALASSETDFRERAATALEAEGLLVVEAERVSPFDAAAEEGYEVAEYAMRLSLHYPVQYGTFDTYPHVEG